MLEVIACPLQDLLNFFALFLKVLHSYELEYVLVVYFLSFEVDQLKTLILEPKDCCSSLLDFLIY